MVTSVLQRKASGHFGEGKWNGVVGKFELGENIEKVQLEKFSKKPGCWWTLLFSEVALDFTLVKRKPADWVVPIFSINSFFGELKESD